METKTATVADFYLTSAWTNLNGAIVQGPTTVTATKEFVISGIPSGADIRDAALTADFGSPLTGAKELRVNSSNVDPGYNTVRLTPSITGNGTYTIIFEFQAFGDASMADGEHSGSVLISGATVTVSYLESSPEPPPAPDPDVDWGPSGRPVSVFAGDAASFAGNGLAVLTPTEGRYRAVAGGLCEITLKHPIDATGKWQYLIPGNIIRAPVPEETIENAFVGIDVELYRTNTGAALREGMVEPQTYSYPEWDHTYTYTVGSRVTCTGWGNYQCLEYEAGSQQAMVPPYNSVWWKSIPDSSEGAPVLVRLDAGSDLYMIADQGNGWYEMSTPMGIQGYIKAASVTYVEHVTPTASDERTIRNQLFRIKTVNADSANTLLTVTAQHVSYDLAAILIKDVTMSQVSPSMAISRVIDGLMMAYRGQIATNLDPADSGTYTGSFNGKNGIFAFLDPDNGIVNTFKAKFARDNWDLFVLQKTSPDRGVRLCFGKNLHGVTWKRDTSSLVTRVVPVAKDQDGEDLYLPELTVDSAHIADYPVIMMQRLQVKGQIGKDDGTGTDTAWTAETLFDEMRQKARERYDVDHADVVYQEITADFEQLGDTAEHPWLKDLERVLLYDLVHVEDARLGLSQALTVTELEWDFIRRKITALKLSTAYDHGLQTVAGYNIGDNSIEAGKLTQAAISEIARLLT